MSKPMTVTLPVILLLLDWWPLQRFSTVPSRTILLEKTPLIVLSGASCIVTLLAQKSGGAVIAIEKLDIPERLANALSSYLVYIRKMVWPFDLALLYPLPSSLPHQATVISTVIIIIVTLAGFHLRKSRPYLLVGWLWYLVMLIPVIGLVQVGIQSNADRYTYLPMIGLTIAVVWGLHSLFGNLRHGYVFLKVLAACMMLMFVFMTRQQVLVWRDSETLFRHALSVTSNNYVMHMNLGITLWNKGKQNEAIDEYRKAIKICPTYADLHFGLANFLLVQGNIVEAAEEYRTTLKLRPDYPFAHTNLGLALQESGQIEDAIVQFKEGLRLVPSDYKASENLQILLNR
jgi:tetratricopeptide (TPR) repeat protein